MYWAKSNGKNAHVRLLASVDFALSAEEAGRSATRAGLVNTVHALARAVDAKDGYTHLHSQRVARYAAALGAALGLREERIEQLRTAGVLHDVGKIGIPDAVLLKPGAARRRPSSPSCAATPSWAATSSPAPASTEIAELGPAPARALRRPRLSGRPRRRGDPAREPRSCTAPTRSRR